MLRIWFIWWNELKRYNGTCSGLYESYKFNYCEERVKQCEYLAEGFYKNGIKGIVIPSGGHGVYINMDEFFDYKRGHEIFAGQGFAL